MEKFADAPFVLLGVNSDPDREELKSILKEESITWCSWWDEGSIDGPIHTQWQVQLRPAIHLLDQNGVIRHRNLPPEKVESAIDELLAHQ